ncbi:hypothetical protein [Desulfotomaculum nigrificans]|uniref:hypothetical protein n=1 Tax=Desulfotomaculum nigrificans TaxID=1565 RepID=UPI0001FAED1A|nr:hypothetical protein [Desulfotomaculum nigrificans]
MYKTVSIIINNLRYLTQPYYIKVKLISGTPTQPYDFMVYADSAYSSLSDITDKELPQEVMGQEAANKAIENKSVTNDAATDVNETQIDATN